MDSSATSLQAPGLDPDSKAYLLWTDRRGACVGCGPGAGPSRAPARPRWMTHLRESDVRRAHLGSLCGACIGETYAPSALGRRQHTASIPVFWSPETAHSHPTGCGVHIPVAKADLEGSQRKPIDKSSYSARGAGMWLACRASSDHNVAFLPTLNASRLRQAGPVRRWYGRARVLLADDESVVQETVKSMLVRIGFDVGPLQAARHCRVLTEALRVGRLGRRRPTRTAKPCFAGRRAAHADP